MIYEINCCLIKWLEDQSTKAGAIEQLNCFHTQNAGIAKIIREKYPQILDADINHGKKGESKRLGSFCKAEITPQKYIFGLYGQYNYGHYTRFTSYDAVCSGLGKIERYAQDNNFSVLGLPKRMGCANGGASWRIVYAIIEDVFIDLPIDLYICNYGQTN